MDNQGNDGRLLALWGELAAAQAEWVALYEQRGNLGAVRLPAWAMEWGPVFTDEEAARLGLAPWKPYLLEDMTNGGAGAVDQAYRLLSAVNPGGRQVSCGARMRAAAEAEKEDRVAAWHARDAEIARVKEETGYAALDRRCDEIAARITALAEEIERLPAEGLVGLLVKARLVQRSIVAGCDTPNAPSVLGLVTDLQRLSGLVLPPVGDAPGDDPSTWDVPVESEVRDA